MSSGSGRVQESLLQGPRCCSTTTGTSSGSAGSIRSTSGPQNSHPDYVAGPRTTMSQDLRSAISTSTTAHMRSSRAGAASIPSRPASASCGTRRCRGHGANFIGNYAFPTNAPFNAADPTTYPWRFQITMGQWISRRSTTARRLHLRQMGGQQAADAEPRRPVRQAGS